MYPPRDSQVQPKQWTWKRILPLTLLAIIGSLAAILMVDEKLKPHDDLKLVPAPAPAPASNGYLYLKERWEGFTSVKGDDRERAFAMLRGEEPIDPAFADKLRKGMESAREELAHAVAMPAWNIPDSANPLDFEAQGWIVKPHISLRLDAMSTLRAGNSGPTVSLLKDLGLLAHLHAAAGGRLITILVGWSIEQVRANVCCESLAQENWNADQLRELQGLWEADLRMAGSWRVAMLHECVLFEYSMMQVEAGKPLLKVNIDDSVTRRLLIKPNKTRNLYYSEMRKLANFKFPPFPDPASAKDAGVGPEPENSPGWKQFLNTNYAGWHLALDGINSIRKLYPSLYRTLFIPRAMRVNLAIRRWRLDHPDQWPADLAELVPDYLPSIPEDPWNGKPLMWDAPLRVIYAVGSDWKPDLPAFGEKQEHWISSVNESPGVRLEIPNPSAPKAP